jgi:hypothetical protein
MSFPDFYPFFLNLRASLFSTKEKVELVRKNMLEHGYIILNEAEFERIFTEIFEFESTYEEALCKIETSIIKFFFNDRIIDIELTPAQKSLAQRISKKYCENGNCKSKPQFLCCKSTACKFKSEKFCINKPNFCLNFFCEIVVKQLSTKVKKILKIEREKEIWNDTIPENNTIPKEVKTY